MTDYSVIKKIIDDADIFLLGIGESMSVLPKTEDPFEGILTMDAHPEEKKAVIEAYNKLNSLIGERPYYVVTMNTDDVIFESEFHKEKIVAPCGSVHMLQCRQHILEPHETRPIYEKMAVDPSFVPYCPVCHERLKLNTIETEGYLEDAYLPAWQRYTTWLSCTLNKKLCVLELGVSFKHPGVIRFPFEKTVFYNKKANFIRVHEKLPQVPSDIADRAYPVTENVFDFLNSL